MLAFKKILSREEKLITKALRGEIARLEPVVRPLVLHVVDAGGKRIRPLMTVMTGKAFGCADPMLYSLAGAVELLHAASLMHDDVVDRSELRRGSPAVHTLFGVDRAILAGDVLLASCMRIVLRSRSFSIIDCVAEAAEKTAAGEVDELNNLRNPELDFAGYTRIITGKTAWLLRCACTIGAMQAGAADADIEAAASFGLELGIAFQLVDDALDIAPAGRTGKPTGGDLREGKVTPLLHFYLEALNERERGDFLRNFTQAALGERDIQGIVEEMRRLRCAERARFLAAEHLEKAALSLSAFPQGEERGFLQAMLDYVRDREH
jgi:octaprenyl-diphosphate synthase